MPSLLDPLPPRQIVNRGMLVPRVEYDDGTQGWGVPGLLMEPVEAWQRLQAGAGENVARMQQGLPFDPQAAGDAFSVAGGAAVGNAVPQVARSLANPAARGAVRTYHGNQFTDPDFNAMRASDEVWSSASPANASQYGAGGYVVPMDVSFSNPLVVRPPRGTLYDSIPFEGDVRDIRDIADIARERGHDGLIVKGIRDAPIGDGEISDTYAALGHGTVKSAITGESLFSNPKEAAALNAALEAKKQGIRFDIPEFSKTTGHARAAIMSGQDEIGHGLFYDLPTARGPDAPDALMLRNIAINKDYQRQGLATALQKEIERRTGKRVMPDDSQLSAAEYSRWLKNDPEAVRNYVDAGNGQFRPHLAANPKEAAALNAALEAKKQGIRAYHGSPHDYAAERLIRWPDGRSEYIVGQPDMLPDVPHGAEVLKDFPLGRQRMDKMGTGEGAQAYGKGLYNAEAEGVARRYRDVLSGSQNAGSGSVKSGRMYEVRINADQERFVDWDRPMTEQHPDVIAAFKEALPDRYKALVDDDEMMAGEVYREVFHNSGNLLDRGAFRRSMRDSDIPGIKYLDQDSRAAGEGTRNFVVFDEKLVDIVRKYGIAGAASMYGVSQAEIQNALGGNSQPRGLLDQ